MKAEIEAWLNSDRLYDAGMLLLKECVKIEPKLDFTFRLCSTGKNDFTKKKLLEALKDMQSSIPSDVKTALPLGGVKKKSARDIPWDTLPAELRELDEELKAAYRKNTHLRGQLRELIYGNRQEPKNNLNQKQRARMSELAHDVMQNQIHINAMWARIDYFLEYGTMLPGTSVEENPQLILLWLSNQVEWVNYLRKSETYFKKHGRYQNEAKVIATRKHLEDINNYILNERGKSNRKTG